MRSIVWPGPRVPSQDFGCSDVVIDGRHVEPWWSAMGCWWHCGIDIPLDVRTPLCAARAGKVTRIGYGLLGIQVDTEMDFYIHIDRAVVVIGQTVARGQLVAYSGDKVPSGGALDGPHLHFERQKRWFLLFRLNNPSTSLDPVPVLVQAASAGSGELIHKEKRRRQCIVATTKSLHEFVRGGAPAFNLYHRRRVNGKWSAWADLGGRLGPDQISAGVDDQGTIIVTVAGGNGDGTSNGLFYDISSVDDGQNFTAFAANGAGGDGMTMLAVLEPSPAAGVAPDLSGVIQAANDAKAAAQAASSGASAAKVASEAAAAATEAIKGNVDQLMGLLPGR